jgi:hypothetical protein
LYMTIQWTFLPSLIQICFVVQKKRWKCEIPIGSNVKLSRVMVAILNFRSARWAKKINKIGKQEVGIWWVQKRFLRYGVPIWSLWPNIRFLTSIVAEKNATKNEHICSMCIKINKVGKQEVGIWWVQKRFPRYGVPIWSLWPNIRFLPSIVAEKNVMKNVHICSMCIKTN